MKYEKRTLVGLTETITVIGKQKKRIVARIDTGASKSSIGKDLAKELGMKSTGKSTTVRSASGTTTRKIVKGKIRIKGRVLVTTFTIADRAHMKYNVLLGQNVLKRNFLIDPTKK